MLNSDSGTKKAWSLLHAFFVPEWSIMRYKDIDMFNKSEMAFYSEIKIVYSRYELYKVSILRYGQQPILCDYGRWAGDTPVAYEPQGPSQAVP
jgi:hypothetical protein